METNLAHKILVGLCNTKNLSSSALGKVEPLTPRANYIIDTILDLQMFEGLHVDIYNDTFDVTNTLFYLNIELTIDRGTDTSVMYVAHHDVNNPNSDNCQDNSASVSNLLSLAKHFRENPPQKTVHIVFTDCEEYGGEGSFRLSNRINEGVFGEVEYVVNLELTANGTNLWHDGENFETQSELINVLNNNAEFRSVKTPFNDSVVLRKNNIDSVCIGTLTDRDFEQVKAKGFCETWAVCHKMSDTIAQANSNDMDNFVEFLSKLV